jgi:predicted transcriptional regulator with HTH domain
MVRRLTRMSGWEEVVYTLLKAYPKQAFVTHAVKASSLDQGSFARGLRDAEALGLVQVRRDGYFKILVLTPRGKEVAEHVKKIKGVVEELEAPGPASSGP